MKGSDTGFGIAPRLLITVNVTDYSECRRNADYSEWALETQCHSFRKVTLPRRIADYSEREELILELDLIQRIDALQITDTIELRRTTVDDEKD